MQITFPHPVRVLSSVPQLMGMRLGSFTNIDNETFAKPALNGFWRFDMQVLADTLQAQLALSAFVTAMSGHANSLVPICVHGRPNDQTGRPLSRGGVAPEFTFDHTGFYGEPFGGFTLRRAASRRDSFIDVNKPALSHLIPGHFISLNDRLHQIVNVVPINELATAVRASVMPPIRADHPVGKVVVVDQIGLRCQMAEGSQPGFGVGRMKQANLSFIEAF